MMLSERKLRLRRLFGTQHRRTLICPMDHGVTCGPLPGLEDMRSALSALRGQPLDAVVLHRGSVHFARDVLYGLPDLALILHLSASVSSSPRAHYKVTVASVEEALRLGADGVSVHVNLGVEGDSAMLESLGKIAGECERYDMPLLAMMYCRDSAGPLSSESEVALAARVAQELGADLVKVSYTGSPHSFERAIRGLSVPVLVAGGESKASPDKLFELVRGALDAGAAGIAVGRAVFQAERPAAMLRGLSQLVHGDKSVSDALREAEIG